MNIVAQGNFQIDYYPKEQMWADILTNILQCKAFREFRVEIGNCLIDYEYDENIDEDL